MKDQGFKEALQKVLAMAKEGAINDDQAAALIEEIAKMDATADTGLAKTPDQAKRGVFERMVDAVSGGRTSVVSGVLASELKENNFSMSQVEVTQGKDAVFQNNTIRMSRLSNIALHGSEISGNTMGSASVSHISATRSQLTGSSIFASSVEHVALEDSSVTALGMRSSVWSHMKLDRTRIEDLAMHAAVLKQLTLGPDLVWEHSKVESSQVKDLQASRSTLNDVAIDVARIAGLTIRGSSLKLSMVRGYKWKDVRFLDSIFEDVLFGAGESNRKCVFADVTFENCTIKKAIFADTVFADVTIRNVTLDNVKVIGINLKDKVIDGNAAFLEAIGAAPENQTTP